METPSSYSLSDRGLKRANNEDAFLDCPDQGLWVVADGMGGNEGGEVASDIVRRTIFQKIRQGGTLPQAIEAAHTQVLDHARQYQRYQGMGSTVVALKSEHNRFQIAWVGDSRAYLWTPTTGGGQLVQLTNDHSHVQTLIDKGIVRPEAARDHPDKHIITQCLGAESLPQLHIETVSGQWQRGQKILLCSDGLTNEVSDQEIAELIHALKNPASIAVALVEKALAHGGKDNVTVQIVEAPASHILSAGNDHSLAGEDTNDSPPQPATTTPVRVIALLLFAALMIWFAGAFL